MANVSHAEDHLKTKEHDRLYNVSFNFSNQTVLNIIAPFLLALCTTQSKL